MEVIRGIRLIKREVKNGNMNRCKLSNYIFSIANAKSDFFSSFFLFFSSFNRGFCGSQNKKNPAGGFLLAHSQGLFVFISTFSSTTHPPSTRTEINCQK